jgi:hypothetical protein
MTPTEMNALAYPCSVLIAAGTLGTTSEFPDASSPSKVPSSAASGWSVFLATIDEYCFG